MIKIYNAEGAIVRRSQNLRGLITHAGRHGVAKVTLTLSGFSSTPYYAVEFTNGDTTSGAFADQGIMVDWFVSRARRWAVQSITINESISRGAFWLSSMRTLARHFTMVSPVTYVPTPARTRADA